MSTSHSEGAHFISRRDWDGLSLDRSGKAYGQSLLGMLPTNPPSVEDSAPRLTVMVLGPKTQREK